MRKHARFTAVPALAVAALAAVLTAGPAAATVTFDPATGKGFVGKGDVQLAFTWNNAQLQGNASAVKFNSTSQTDYQAVCTWITGEGTRGERTHDVSHTTETAVNSQVAYDARTHKQVDGFVLTGLGTTIESGTVPVVGGACPGNDGTQGTWSAVAVTGSSAGLYVQYSTTSVLLASF